MTALAQIAPLRPEEIFARLDDVRAAYETGSVITVDHSISVFARLCKADRDREPEILPLLLNHLANCRAKEIPQHLERMTVCVTAENAARFRTAVAARCGELSKPQQARVTRTLKQFPG